MKKDYFKEVFELSNTVKRLTEKRKATLLKAEEKLIEAWKASGLDPVEIPINGKKYIVGTRISSMGFGSPEFATTGISADYAPNGFWRYGNYRGKENKDLLEYYKDFCLIKDGLKQALENKIEVLK